MVLGAEGKIQQWFPCKTMIINHLQNANMRKHTLMRMSRIHLLGINNVQTEVVIPQEDVVMYRIGWTKAVDGKTNTVIQRLRMCA